MSTILRALQRVEGEKDGEAEMGALREGVVPPGEPLVRSGRGRWRIGITACVSVALLGFFVWWMIPREEVPQPSVQPSAEVAPPPVAAAPPELRQRAAVPHAPPHPVERPTARVAAAPPPSHPVERPAARVAAAPAPPPLVEGPAARKPVVEKPPPPLGGSSKPRQRAAVAAPPPSSIEESAPRKPVETVPPSSAAPPPPIAEPVVEPSPRLAKPPAPKPRARVATIRPPKITVDKTIWHPTPERRVARIEMEGHKGPLDLHEGDAIGTLVVAEIQPSGVVFLHGGERLYRKVGEGR